MIYLITKGRIFSGEQNREYGSCQVVRKLFINIYTLVTKTRKEPFCLLTLGLWGVQIYHSHMIRYSFFPTNDTLLSIIDFRKLFVFIIVSSKFQVPDKHNLSTSYIFCGSQSRSNLVMYSFNNEFHFIKNSIKKRTISIVFYELDFYFF